MKRAIITLTALTALTLSAVAQIDLGITAISEPASGATIHSIAPTRIKATITNFSDQAFPAGEVDITVLVDGNEAARQTIEIDKDIPAGGTKKITAIPFLEGISFGNSVLCVSVEHAEDADASNNTSPECVDLPVSGRTDIDLRIESTTIISPIGINHGGDVKGGQKIKEFSFSFYNMSGVTLPEGMLIPIVVSVDGEETAPIIFSTDMDLKTGDFTIFTYNHKESEIAIPTLPDEAGKNFDLCFKHSYPYDKEYTDNNAECMNLTVLDNSNSIHETLPSLNIQSNANGLIIDLSSLGSAEVLNYEIIGLSGRTLSSGNGNGQTILQISNKEIPYNEPFIIRLNTPEKAMIEKLFISR